MATTYKNLGQSAPSAASETPIYTVPGLTSAIVSSLMVANRSASSDKFRVSVSVGGGATATKDYIYYDVTINGNDTFAATLGLSLATTDVVRVYSGTANLSFSLWGAEIT